MSSLDHFLQERRPSWQRLHALVEQVENSGLRSLDDNQAVEFARLYRRTASDLNQAQTFVAGDATVRHLNALVARCYVVIHSHRRAGPADFLRKLVLGYPAVFRRCAGSLLLATAIIGAGAAFGFAASSLDGAVARDLLLPDMPMIQPGEQGRAMTAGDLAGYSSFLFTNNTRVALTACALGMTWGVGTALLLWYNGLILGVLAAIFAEAGELESFATGVLPHGVLEIPAVLIGGAAGFVLAGALVRARPWPRLEELTHAGRRALWLVAGCFPLLAVAALLEAGVARAPDWFLDRGVKLAIAALFALLFMAYVLLFGRGTTGAELASSGKSTSPLVAFRRGPVGRGRAFSGGP